MRPLPRQLCGLSHEVWVNTMNRIMAGVLGTSSAFLFILLLMGLGALLESHTFRASVSGRIADTEGHPISGARVEYCLPNAPGDTIEYDRSSRTNAEGRYSMNLPGFMVALDTSPDYTRRVRISADGYAPSYAHIMLKKGHNPDCDYILSRCTDVRSAARPFETSTSDPARMGGRWGMTLK